MSWRSEVVLLHAICDAATVFACLSIAALLLNRLRRRQEFPFRWMPWILGSLAGICGITRAFDAVSLWYPFERFPFILEGLTAAASIGTSIAILLLMARAFHTPSHVEAEVSMGENVQVCRAHSVERIQTGPCFRAMFEEAGIGLAHVSLTGNFLEVNERFCALVGYQRGELVQPSFGGINRLEAELGQARNLLPGVSRQYSTEKRFIHKDGHAIWVNLTVSLVVPGDGSTESLIAVVEDLTRSRAAEARVLESERKFRELGNALPHLVWTARPDGSRDYYNDRWYQLTAFDVSASEETRWRTVLHPEDLRLYVERWDAAVHSKHPFEVQCRLWDRRLAEFRWYLGKATPVKNEEGEVIRWIGTCTDIHEQKIAKEALEDEMRHQTLNLEKSLLEKETLLKELHHRVKNNLQVISSLLRMQSEAVKDPSAATALKDSHERVLSMALIHERLYGNQHMDEIDFGEYTQTLVDDLFYSSGDAPGRVSSRVDASLVFLNIDQAIPCGLILNELVTNALKYAYPAGSSGEVHIELMEATADQIRLTVSDNGIGLPEGLDWTTATSLGLPLVDILSRQLGGTLRARSGPGTTLSVEFPKKRGRWKAA